MKNWKMKEKLQTTAKESGRPDRPMKATKLLFWLAAAAIVMYGAGRTLPDVITVSNSVNGRELPIYCVETSEKKVALSFDAAWGNSNC